MTVQHQARQILAQAVDDRGPSWRSAADSIRGGTYANVWILAALAGIERALRMGPDAEETD